MFQPRRGTATILGSVASVTSYLKTLSHRLTIFWIRPFNLRFPTPPPPIRHPETDLHRSSHPIFHPHSGLGPPGQTSVNSRRSPPPVLHLLSFPFDRLSRYQSENSSPLQEPISAALPPFRLPPFCCPQRCFFVIDLGLSKHLT